LDSNSSSDLTTTKWNDSQSWQNDIDCFSEGQTTFFYDK